MVKNSQLSTHNSQLALLRFRHTLLKAMRDFFYSRDYLEVETPNLMTTAAPDPNIEPLQVYVDRKGPYFLHTSPEMGMKNLHLGHERIFQICENTRLKCMQNYLYKFHHARYGKDIPDLCESGNQAHCWDRP